MLPGGRLRVQWFASCSAWRLAAGSLDALLATLADPAARAAPDLTPGLAGVTALINLVARIYQDPCAGWCLG